MPTGADLAEDAGLPIVLVDDSAGGARRHRGVGLPHRASDPPLLFGTTGTNGKTSTSYLLEAILRQLGLVTGLSSTAERHIGDLTVVSRLDDPGGERDARPACPDARGGRARGRRSR